LTNNSKIQDLALRLTGSTHFQSDSNWLITPADWICPACKRSKLHLAKINKQGVLQGNIHNHHDHIDGFLKLERERLNKEKLTTTPSNKESYFYSKIKLFFNRFDETLICQDCNNADSAAKSNLERTCPHFSFSPAEIRLFITPRPNKEHQIDYKKSSALYETLEKIHINRKNIAAKIIIDTVSSDIFWGEASGPSKKHYEAAKKIAENPECFDGSSVNDLKFNSNIELAQFSKALNKIEKKKFNKKSLTDDEKEKIKITRKIEKEDMLATYPNRGKPWDKNDLKKIHVAFTGGIPIEEIANIHERTPTSIKYQLEIMGFDLNKYLF
jgi:hypothetical protein